MYRYYRLIDISWQHYTRRPKKFRRPWSSVMKRVYITAEICAKLCQVKKAKGFTSYKCTLRYLLNCYEGISAIATKDPAAIPPSASSSSLYAPVEAPVTYVFYAIDTIKANSIKHKVLCPIDTYSLSVYYFP